MYLQGGRKEGSTAAGSVYFGHSLHAAGWLCVQLKQNKLQPAGSAWVAIRFIGMAGIEDISMNIRMGLGFENFIEWN